MGNHARFPHDHHDVGILDPLQGKISILTRSHDQTWSKQGQGTRGPPGHTRTTWTIRTGTTTAHMARPTNWPSLAHDVATHGAPWARWGRPADFRMWREQIRHTDPPFVTFQTQEASRKVCSIVLVGECYGIAISFVHLSEGLRWLKRQMKRNSCLLVSCSTSALIPSYFHIVPVLSACFACLWRQTCGRFKWPQAIRLIRGAFAPFAFWPGRRTGTALDVPLFQSEKKVGRVTTNMKTEWK